MKTKRPITEMMSVRIARAQKRVDSNRFFRLLGARGAATLALGAALSIGGLTDAVSGVHFEVAKGLDSVQVVRHSNNGRAHVTNLGTGFTGNTVFKLSQIFPERIVSRELSLFDAGWLPQTTAGIRPPAQKHHDTFVEELARINDAFRREFFTSEIPFGDLIHEKAAKYDVDPALVAAVIEQESKFRSTARSHVGARGLMQLMPRTGRWMGARDLYDPEQNIDAGVKYIKYLQERFDGNLTKTIAAYNAGEGNVMRYQGVPPFRETRTYVKKVMQNYNKRNKQIKAYEKERTSSGGTTDVEGVATLR